MSGWPRRGQNPGERTPPSPFALVERPEGQALSTTAPSRSICSITTQAIRKGEKGCREKKWCYIADIGPRQVGAIDLDVIEVCFADIRPSEIGAPQIAASKIGPPQITPRKLGSREVHLLHGTLGEDSLLEGDAFEAKGVQDGEGKRYPERAITPSRLIEQLERTLLREYDSPRIHQYLLLYSPLLLILLLKRLHQSLKITVDGEASHQRLVVAAQMRREHVGLQPREDEGECMRSNIEEDGAIGESMQFSLPFTEHDREQALDMLRSENVLGDVEHHPPDIEAKDVVRTGIED